MTIHAETQVVITMKALLAGTAAVLAIGAGILWGVLSFTIGGVRDDVSAIRQSVITLQGTDREGIQRSNDISVRLTDQIQGLRTDFVKYSERFDAVAGKLDNVNKSIDALTGRIDKFQDELRYTQASFNDPKRIGQIVDEMKKSGLDGSRIIIVPLGPGPAPLK